MSTIYDPNSLQSTSRGENAKSTRQLTQEYCQNYNLLTLNYHCQGHSENAKSTRQLIQEYCQNHKSLTLNCLGHKTTDPVKLPDFESHYREEKW